MLSSANLQLANKPPQATSGIATHLQISLASYMKTEDRIHGRQMQLAPRFQCQSLRHGPLSPFLHGEGDGDSGLDTQWHDARMGKQGIQPQDPACRTLKCLAWPISSLAAIFACALGLARTRNLEIWSTSSHSLHTTSLLPRLAHPSRTSDSRHWRIHDPR
jgi:hypothetical protein